jgi:hypothetical protein
MMAEGQKGAPEETAIARQRYAKYVSAATDTHTTIE